MAKRFRENLPSSPTAPLRHSVAMSGIERQHRSHQALPQPPRRRGLALVDPLDQPLEHVGSLALLGLGHAGGDRTASLGVWTLAATIGRCRNCSPTSLLPRSSAMEAG
jgi:hypothetical protein